MRWAPGPLAALILIAASPHDAGAQGVPVAPVVRDAFLEYTDDEIVEILALEPGVYVQPWVRDGFPIGHPLVSAGDCAANPESQGCRTLRVKALAESRGVDADRFCVSFRPYAYVKREGFAVDTVGGATFDADWLVRVPGDAFESDLSRWPNGLLYASDVDAEWFEANEDACCHDGVDGTCGAKDRCIARYGRSDDVARTFTVTFAVVDLRQPFVRRWMMKKLFAKFDDTASDCVVIGAKPGWFSQPRTPQGASQCPPVASRPPGEFDPCAWTSALLSRPPYERNEYEAILNEYFESVFDRLDRRRQRGADVLVLDTPYTEDGIWSWMDAENRARSDLVGELDYVSPLRPPPPPDFRVYLARPPLGAQVPILDVPLPIEVRGSAAGPIDYYAWCDCDDATTDVAAAQARCGTAPGTYYERLGQSFERTVFFSACDYTEPGISFAKVIARRDGVAGEDRIAVDACAADACEPCRNAADDDLDGKLDHPDDPGCTSPWDASERSPTAPCDDGADNDLDGKVDYPYDKGCRSPLSTLENPACDDGLDNDGDGLFDWDGAGRASADPGCSGAGWRASEEARRSCGLGAELVLALLPLLAWRRRAR